jgi:SNF2 family DNA or RNA helicase
MAKDFIPRGPFQEEATKFIIRNERCQLSVDMGLGKTSMTLNAIETLAMCGWPYPVLILAPKRVARNTWSDECGKWNHTKHLVVSTIVGDPGERKAALKHKADIYTINYENLPWLVETLNGEWPFKMVVADESTKLKSHRAHFITKKDGSKSLVCSGGVRTNAIAKLSFKKTKRWVNLTGKPAPNGLLDLYGQYWFIDAGQRLGRCYTAFEERWFKTGFNGYEKVMLPHAEEEIKNAIADVTFTLRAEDYLDLGEEIFNTIYVDLPPKAEKHYREMEKSLFTEIQAGEVEVFSQAAKSAKCHQMANGSIYYTKDGKFEIIHDAKIEALESVIEEAAGTPVIVCYNFKADLIRLKRAFPKGIQFDTKPQTEKDFKAGKISLLFLHPKSAGHGIDQFQYVTNIMCFFSLDWDADAYEQAIARIGKVRQFQAGLGRTAYIHRIATRDTVDMDILNRLENKISIEAALKEGLARRHLK